MVEFIRKKDNYTTKKMDLTEGLIIYNPGQRYFFIYLLRLIRMSGAINTER